MCAIGSAEHANRPMDAGLAKRFHAWLMLKISETYEERSRERKLALFEDISGTVLEIGPGTGPNLKYYPANIYWIGIEPNPFMHVHLKAEAQRLGLPIELRGGSAERLEAEDGSVDAVVSTLVLCSVADLAHTFREIRRVLKPGGRFYFLEHVAARRGTALRSVQRLIRPLWSALGDGCQPDRETWSVLETAGFSRLEYEHFTMKIPITGPHIAGVAVK